MIQTGQVHNNKLFVRLVHVDICEKNIIREICIAVEKYEFPLMEQYFSVSVRTWKPRFLLHWHLITIFSKENYVKTC